MDTLVLKSKIIKRIAQIEDPAFLKAIQTIVDSNQSEIIFNVPDFLKAEIKQGRDQYRDLEYTDDDDLSQEINTWLKERK